MSNTPVPVPGPLCPVEAAIEAEIERRRLAREEILAAAPIPLARWIHMRLLVAEVASAHEAGLPVRAMMSGAVAAIEDIQSRIGARRG